MARRRRDLSLADREKLLRELAAFRSETLIPYSATVPPTSDGYQQAQIVHDALLIWADSVAGRRDALLAPPHGTPPVKSKESDAD